VRAPPIDGRVSAYRNHPPLHRVTRKDEGEIPRMGEPHA
jgi:hypothetical protein